MLGILKSFFVKLSILIVLCFAIPASGFSQETEARKVKKKKPINESKQIKNAARAKKKRRKHAYKIQDKATRKRMRKAYKSAMRRQKGKKPRSQ